MLFYNEFATILTKFHTKTSELQEALLVLLFLIIGQEDQVTPVMSYYICQKQLTWVTSELRTPVPFHPLLSTNHHGSTKYCLIVL